MNSTTGKLGAIVLFWLGVGLIQTFNWGDGLPKAAVMLAMLVAVPFVLRAANRPPTPLAPGLARGVAIAFWIALGLNLLYLAGRIVAPHLIDIATTTLAAGQALLHGHNPYVVPIDRGPETFGFTGYKYYPMMIVDYLPLGALLGQRGVQLTNLIVWLGCLALMRRLAGNRLAPLLLMILPLAIQQIFAKGATDLATVLPLLGAFVLVERRPFWCGILTGLSLATKPLPGLAALPALIPPRGRAAFIAGLVVGLLPVVPFLIAAPQSFFFNAIVFNLVRPPDDTAWLHAVPAAIATAAHVVVALSLIAGTVGVWLRRPPLTTRLALATALILGAILAGPGAHHNYQLWWLPFYGVLLSLALAPARGFGYTSGAKVTAKGA